MFKTNETHDWHSRKSEAGRRKFALRNTHFQPSDFGLRTSDL